MSRAVLKIKDEYINILRNSLYVRIGNKMSHFLSVRQYNNILCWF